MPPPRHPTSTSTENLVLRCQKETHRRCLPPVWAIHPPNQEIHPPKDTLAIAVQIDASSPNTVQIYESDTNRSVGSIGPEYRGSIVVVPWRPGLKFVCSATCRRRSGCRVGVVREAKAKGVLKTKSIGAAAGSVARNSIAAGNHTRGPVLDNTRRITTTSPATVANAARITPDGGTYDRNRLRIIDNKRPGHSKHVSFDDRSMSGKNSIEVRSIGSSIPRLKKTVQQSQKS
ncbi:hypothetical protein TARUN_381 [Trichoderma arundinaceum]|uniref:Uncharacterized protein n=1 Tax=Trichoderma arundinaceum TaxID=490622 RepID=A0A395P2H4_TRIAR|nr:hypothetical protein TARUN_381 [Trichoderma arundinaceum]